LIGCSPPDAAEKHPKEEKSKVSGKHVSNEISSACKILFGIYPHLLQIIAGKLSLCIGMPVIIRNNDATELCITKGRKAMLLDAGSRAYMDNVS